MFLCHVNWNQQQASQQAYDGFTAMHLLRIFTIQSKLPSSEETFAFEKEILLVELLFQA
jgi:hypothetical protein